MDALVFSLADVLLLIIRILTWIIIISVIMSWLIAFNVLNLSNQVVRTVYEAVHRLTEPIFGPIRRMLPDLGGIDISPLIVLVILFFLQSFIARSFL
jgi:YggT family protein